MPDNLISIGYCVFDDCSSLVNITIPDTVKYIGEGAFSGVKFKNIDIPDSVIEIGNYAFSGCEELETVYISENVTNIKGNPFDNCANLKSINVDTENKYYCSTSNALYTKDMTEVITYFEGLENTVFTIPEGVTTVRCSFFYASHLENIGIPSTVKVLSDFSHNLRNIHYQGDENAWKELSSDISIVYYTNVHYNCYPGNYTETVTPPTHFHGTITTFTCDCGISYDKWFGEAIPHNYEFVEVVAPNCYAAGYTSYRCECGDYYIEDYVDALGPLGHLDDELNDGICDYCGETLCSHMCHKTGFVGFFWKIINFLQKLFGTGKYCDCGAAHY